MEYINSLNQPQGLDNESQNCADVMLSDFESSISSSNLLTNREFAL